MLFRKKKYSLPEVAPLVVDTHSHLIIGVDDGVGSEAEFWEAMASLEQLGVERAFTTPHIKAELTNSAQQLREIAQHYTGYPIEIRLGAEYMLDEALEKHLGDLLSYDGQHVLVEFARMAAVIGSEELISRLQMEGYTPVLAHPERYSHLSTRRLAEMRERGVAMQLCIPSLLGGYGETIRERARKLLAAGIYTFVGSDSHGTLGGAITRKTITAKEAELYAELADNNVMLWK